MGAISRGPSSFSGGSAIRGPSGGNWNGSNWNGSSNWNGGGNWNQNGSWNGRWNGDHHDNSWAWGLGLGLALGGWPGGYGYGGYGGYGYGGYGGYDGGYYGGYPYGDSYAMSVPSYYVQPAVNQPVVQPFPEATPAPAADPVQTTTAQPTPQPDPAAASGYYSAALAAFRNGDYHGAVRAAAHAAIDDPRNSRPHELASLALFAAGEYRGAAIEAHAALALGPASNWDTIAGYYGGANEPFTTQLRNLERHSAQNPSAGDAQFLLGYLYQSTGYPEEAKAKFAESARLVPADQLASKLGGVTNAGSTAPPLVKPAPRGVPPVPTPPNATPPNATPPETTPATTPAAATPPAIPNGPRQQ